MKDFNNKELAQYSSAIITLLSGIVLVFISFFLSPTHEVAGSVLAYMGEALVFCGGIFGVSLMIKTKFAEASCEVDDKMEKITEFIKKELERIRNEKTEDK